LPERKPESNEEIIEEKRLCSNLQKHTAVILGETLHHLVQGGQTPPCRPVRASGKRRIR
jgi:hypothetical protein